MQFKITHVSIFISNFFISYVSIFISIFFISSLSIFISLFFVCHVSVSISFLFISHVSLFISFLFLVADTQLYKRLCSSVCRSIHWSLTLESISGKTSVLDVDASRLIGPHIFFCPSVRQTTVNQIC